MEIISLLYWLHTTYMQYRICTCYYLSILANFLHLDNYCWPFFLALVSARWLSNLIISSAPPLTEPGDFGCRCRDYICERPSMWRGYKKFDASKPYPDCCGGSICADGRILYYSTPVRTYRPKRFIRRSPHVMGIKFAWLSVASLWPETKILQQPASLLHYFSILTLGTDSEESREAITQNEEIYCRIVNRIHL